MDILGNVNLKGNELQNGRFEHLDDFPADPKVGTWSFIRKQLMLCVQLEELPVWVPLTPERNTYLHEQKSESAEWVIPHKLDQESVMVQCFDGSNSVITPSEIVYVDTMTTKVTFPDAIVGKAIVMFGYTEGAHVDGKFKGSGGLPVGTIFRVARKEILELDDTLLPLAGQTVTKEFFPDLVYVLSGQDPNATEVVLDDPRGVFTRNLDYGKGRDALRKEGVLQNQQNLRHAHNGIAIDTDLGSKRSTTSGHHNHVAYGALPITEWFYYEGGGGMEGIVVPRNTNRETSWNGNHEHDTYIGKHGHALAIDSEGGEELRPDNYAYLLVIKAKT